MGNFTMEFREGRGRVRCESGANVNPFLTIMYMSAKNSIYLPSTNAGWALASFFREVKNLLRSLHRIYLCT